ncbi:MAG TPA: hypothetical protein VLL52_07735 [Anaerolineae bacterium]|nr:hypothetical protein [Anaerolineae bacterium]
MMHTLIIRTTPRTLADKKTYRVDVLGESSIRAFVYQSAKELAEEKPPNTARQALMNALALIEKHNLEIKFTEHEQTEDDDTWFFIVQG